MKHKRWIFFGLAAVALVIVGLVIVQSRQPEAAAPASQSSAANPTFDKQQYSIVDPNSIWVVINKQRQLQPANYSPDDLVAPNIPLRTRGEEMTTRKVTAQALEAMFADAKKDGINLMLSSGYRSFNFQTGLYNRYVSQIGQASADTQSARPGYSEHQTGLAVDVEPASRQCEIEACFADTPEGKWVAANAYKYGFIIRYTPDKTAVTGYTYEPWHIRYVGPELATQMHQQNIETLEEFFGLPPAPTYN